MKPVIDAVRKQLQVRTGNIRHISEENENLLFFE